MSEYQYYEFLAIDHDNGPGAMIGLHPWPRPDFLCLY